MSKEFRINKLKELKELNPRDPFPIYGLALEFIEQNPIESATYFLELMDNFPDYLPSYYHYGQLLVAQGDLLKAKTIYRAGILLAEKQHDLKTKAELATALLDIEDE